MNRIKIVITAAMLAALSMAFQLVRVQSGTGMDIDLVAVPWILSAFLLGPLGGAITTATTTILIALNIGSATGWAGATIKLLASLPLVVAFALIRMRTKNPTAPLLLSALALAIVARVLIAHTVNAAFTFPMFGLPVEAQLDGIFGIPLGFSVSWIGAIDVLNVLQSLIEFAVVYVVLSRTRLRERFHY